MIPSAWIFCAVHPEKASQAIPEPYVQLLGFSMGDVTAFYATFPKICSYSSEMCRSMRYIHACHQ